MSDTAVVIATISTCIALLSCVMSWLALQHSAVVQQRYNRLHKEFWRQSLIQVDHNCNTWRTHVKNCEQIAFILKHLQLAYAPPSDKPPDIPLN